MESQLHTPTLPTARRNISSASKTLSPLKEVYRRLTDAEIADLREDGKNAQAQMQAFGNDPSNIATMRPELRDAILKNKPHLRSAVENLLRKVA